MGQIVGMGVVSHVPPIVLPEAERRQFNNGQDITLVSALERIRSEKLDHLNPDTVVVFDTHWFTLLHHVFDARENRAGLFTSEEIPTNPGMRSRPYDLPGDPELCRAVAELAEPRDDTWVVACDEPNLPMAYGTVNLLPYLQGAEKWVRVGICQSAEPEDFLLLGELLGQAIASLDRRVVLLASGSLSHRFWPLRELRLHESSDPSNIVTPEARAADEAILEAWKRGDHASVIDGTPDFMQFAPEGRFGHYLMMVGAVGGRSCTAPGEMFSAYESAAGTAQVDMWFDRPTDGWTT